MQYDSIIKWTNRVAYYAIIALLYWIVAFIVIQVFGLKIMREHLTELFFISVLGILGLLAAALMLSIMSNLSKISAAVALNKGAIESPVQLSQGARRKWWLMAISLPVVIGLLFAGDYASAQKKKSMLIQTAQGLIQDNQAQLNVLSQYQFNREYIQKAHQSIEIIKRTDKNFPEVALLQPDMIDDKTVTLGFGNSDWTTKDAEPTKTQFIFSADKKERAYLQSVFSGQTTEPYFENANGNYQLMYPVVSGQKIMVLVFSDYQRYGKMGS